MSSKPVFLDVDPSIVERNLKLTQDNDSEIDKLFNVPHDDYPSKLVKPVPVTRESAMERNSTQEKKKESTVIENEIVIEDECIENMEEEITEVRPTTPSTIIRMNYTDKSDYVRVTSAEDIDLLSNVVISRARISRFSTSRVQRMVDQGLDYTHAKRAIIKDNFLRRRRRFKPFYVHLSRAPCEIKKNRIERTRTVALGESRSQICAAGTITEPENETIKLAVVSANHPDGSNRMTLDKLKAIENSIIEAYDCTRDNNLQIRFTECTRKPDHLILTCADSKTADWLRRIVCDLKPWEDARLVAIEGEDISRPWVCRMFVPNENERKVRASKILSRLEISNNNLKVRLWANMGSSLTARGAYWSFFVDDHSFNELWKLKMRPYFGLGRLQFQVKCHRSEKSTKSIKHIEKRVVNTKLTPTLSLVRDPQPSASCPAPETIIVVDDDEENSPDASINLSE